MKNYNKYMDTQASKERKFTQTMEKWIMYFMYALFGGLFLLISLTGSFSEGLVLLPVAVVSIPLTKWGIRWQNERYIRSAQNQDDIDIIKERLAAKQEGNYKLADQIRDELFKKDVVIEDQKDKTTWKFK